MDAGLDQHVTADNAVLTDEVVPNAHLFFKTFHCFPLFPSPLPPHHSCHHMSFLSLLYMQEDGDETSQILEGEKNIIAIGETVTVHDKV